MRTILLAALLCSSVAMAVDTPAPDDAAKRALATDLLDAMGAKNQAQQAIDQLKRSQENMLKMARLAPGEEEKQREMQERIRNLIAGEFAWDKWKDDYIRIYATSMTEAELRELTAFYRSPVGQSYVAKTPEIQKQIQDIVLQRMTNVNAQTRAIVAEYMPRQPRTLPAHAPEQQRPGPYLPKP